MNKHKQYIILYIQIMRNLAEELCDKYGRPKDIDILGDENIGLGPIDILSYVVSLDQIICALENDIPKEIFIDYYYYCSEKYRKGEEAEYNLYNYFKKGILKAQHRK